MRLTACVGMGILFVFTVIGLWILFRQDSFQAEKKKRVCVAAGVLQALHLTLYLTGLLDQMNGYLAFGICSVVSILCLVMSGWLVLPCARFRHGIKYLLLFLAILQVISTIVLFLLPDAGLPPIIHLK